MDVGKKYMFKKKTTYNITYGVFIDHLFNSGVK